MTTYDISASSIIPAAPQTVYTLIADYRNGHPRILPKPYFLTLNVTEGGYGEGTVIDFQMKIMGQVQSFHSVITEPSPGRVLVETDIRSGSVTTFKVEPHQDGTESFVTITTTIRIPAGVMGKIQGWLTARLLRPIYEKELKQLAEVAVENNKPQFQ